MTAERNGIKDIKSYLKDYFNSAAGKKALNPPPKVEVDKRGRKIYIHKNPMMAQAFYEAAHDKNK